jgi:hypothetical protein
MCTPYYCAAFLPADISQDDPRGSQDPPDLFLLGIVVTPR